jgi:hypothetical protein
VLSDPQSDAFGLARHRDGRWEWARAPGVSPSARYQVCVLTLPRVCVNPTQVCVNPTQVCVLTLPRVFVNPTQVCVLTLPRVCVNPTQGVC